MAYKSHPVLFLGWGNPPCHEMKRGKVRVKNLTVVLGEEMQSARTLSALTHEWPASKCDGRGTIPKDPPPGKVGLGE